jgi:hypothetical protein
LESRERCPQCKKRFLATVVVYGKGSLEICLCGYERVIEPVDPADLEREHWKWKEGLSPVALRFRGIEALLQSIYDAQVCEVCAERAVIEDLRARAMELEHRRSYLAMDHKTYSKKRMDAYLVDLVEQLQGVGQLCEPCWEKIVQTAMRRFYGR